MEKGDVMEIITSSLAGNENASPYDLYYPICPDRSCERCIINCNFCGNNAINSDFCINSPPVSVMVGLSLDS